MRNYLREIYDAALTHDAEIKYKYENGSLRMDRHNMPLSIKNDEFAFLRDFVVDHNLKRGFEVATAFGISATAFGLGLLETGGRMVTMDAYIEEQFDDCSAYQNQKGVYEHADGFKSVNFLIDTFDLHDIIIPTVGWSPDDTAAMITQEFADEKLDFVFIDALHYDDALLADLKSVMPFLDDRHAVFFHDIHCFSQDTINFIQSALGQELIRPQECKYIPGSHRGGYNLAYIYNA